MSPLMYRHRPSRPALIAALVVLAAGAAIAYYLKRRSELRDFGLGTVLMALTVTVAISGSLLIAAFARYAFTHLWKSTGARHSDKYKDVEKQLRKESRGRW